MALKENKRIGGLTVDLYYENDMDELMVIMKLDDDQTVLTPSQLDDLMWWWVQRRPSLSDIPKPLTGERGGVEYT